MLVLVDVGFLKAHFQIDLVPLTLEPYLGSRSERVKVPWNLHSLMEYFLANYHGITLMSLDRWILQMARH